MVFLLKNSGTPVWKSGTRIILWKSSDIPVQIKWYYWKKKWYF